MPPSRRPEAKIHRQRKELLMTDRASQNIANGRSQHFINPGWLREPMFHRQRPAKVQGD